VVKVSIRQLTTNSPDFVIPSEARDLHFRGKLQVPRFARDDNPSKVSIVQSAATFRHGG
jgi:hypothetical protein